MCLQSSEPRTNLGRTAATGYFLPSTRLSWYTCLQYNMPKPAPAPEFACYRCGFCCLQFPCNWGRGRMADKDLARIYAGRGYCKFLKFDKTFKATCLLLKDSKIGKRVRQDNHVGQGCLDWQTPHPASKVTPGQLVNWLRARRIYWLAYGTITPSKMTAACRRQQEKARSVRARRVHA